MRGSEPRHYEIALEEVSLKVHEWAGQGDPVLLLHATGFHSRCWDQVVQRLPGLHIYAVDLRFHGQSGAAGEVDWKIMANDIEQLIEKLDLRQILGVGHSIGGYLIARVAAGRSERFRALVLIDPVIFAPDHYRQHAHLADVDPATHPVSRRKNQWRDSAEMFERFQARPPFNRWQAAVLRDYCNYALEEVPGESFYELACDPLHEAAIYLSQAGNEDIHELLAALEIPVTLMRAAARADDAVDFSTSPTWSALASHLPDCREIYLPQMSHFIPMEDPQRVAQVITERHRA